MKFNNPDDLAKYFKKAIEAESSVEIESLTKEIESVKSAARQQFKVALEEEKLDILSARARDIFKQYQEELSIKQRTLDLLVMEKRMHLIDELFKALEAAVEAFRTTPENKTWFLNKLKKYDTKLFETIELNEKDKALAPSHLKIKINNQIRAGFILHNQNLNRIVVETISSNLAEARNKFYETAQWFSE